MVVIQFPTFVKVSALHKSSPYCIGISETWIRSRESIICFFLVQRIKCEVVSLHKCASMDGCMQRQSVQSLRSGRYDSQSRLVLNTKMLLTLNKKITQDKVVPQLFQQHAGSNCTLKRLFFFSCKHICLEFLIFEDKL